MGKGVDCVFRGERNLCTILGGLGFTALFFLGGVFKGSGQAFKAEKEDRRV
jgi:hypothetical protein